MEIGNENSGPGYEERYEVFYKAIKARHPRMHLLANVVVKVCSGRNRRRPLLQRPGMVPRKRRIL